jgi:hypothetical protein
MWAVGVVNLVLIIAGVTSAQVLVIVGTLIFVPIVFVVELVVLRIICELCVVILLLPYYIQRTSGGAGGMDDSGGSRGPIVGLPADLNTNGTKVGPPGKRSGVASRGRIDDDDDAIDISIHSKLGDEQL